MGDDAYWQVPDGRDYYREIELHHKRLGHIIQPFTSLSITHLNPLPPSTLSLQLWDTIRPVCYESRVERSRQGHDNKLADGCRENKGRWQLDNIAIPFSQKLSSTPSVERTYRSERCFDPHPLTSMIGLITSHCWRKFLWNAKTSKSWWKKWQKKIKCHLYILHTHKKTLLSESIHLKKKGKLQFQPNSNQIVKHGQVNPDFQRVISVIDLIIVPTLNIIQKRYNI